MDGAAISAIQSGSGVMPHKLSLLIRTILLVLIFIWGAYMALSVLKDLRSTEMDMLEGMRKMFGVLFVIIITGSLVFVV